jgi:hypothetical protein
MPERKRILYRGVPMVEGWPEKITAAQRVRSYTLDGRPVLRIPYGNEREDWGANQHACHDCRVLKGELHVGGCDGEECPMCNRQLLSCDCPFDEREADFE